MLGALVGNRLSNELVKGCCGFSRSQIGFELEIGTSATSSGLNISLDEKAV